MIELDPASAWFLLLIAVLLGFSGLFSGSETAFFSLDSLKLKRLQEKEGQKAAIILSLLASPRKLLITILVGNETVNVAATSIATAFSIKLFGDKGTGLAIGGMLLLVLIFGEITPKTIAIHHPIPFALRTVHFINFFHKLIKPLRNGIQRLVDYLIKPFLQQSSVNEAIITEEEFQSLLDISQAEGILKDSQHEMIKNALEFTETTVDEVMTPREEIFCLPAEESLDSATRKIKKKFFSRVPVYQGGLNNIKGILYTKDLLIAQYQANPPQNAGDLLHPPCFVSGDKRVVDLLREFQKTRNHLAVVINATGKTAGIVTLEDLLEELFGEIVGEAKSKTRLLRKIRNDRYLVSAMMHIEDFNQRFNSRIDDEEYDTLGGILQELFGPKPFPGESHSYQGMEFVIQKVKGRKILEVVVETSPEGKK